MTPPRFEPFQDRLSRDIRNALAAALPLALAQNNLTPVKKVAERYRQQWLAAPAPYVNYIEARLAGYAKALAIIARTGAEGALAKGLVLWDTLLESLRNLDPRPPKLLRQDPPFFAMYSGRSMVYQKK